MYLVTDQPNQRDWAVPRELDFQIVNPDCSLDLYKSIVALLVGNPPLTRDFGPVEVKGFEPSASALRMCGSQCFD